MKHSATLNSFLILPSSSCRMPSNLVAMSRWRLQQFLPLPLDELQPACLSCSADSSKQGSFSFCGMRASAHLTSMNCRNSTSQVTCHNRSQSVHECFEGQGVCLDPQVASSSVPASMAERPPRVTVLLGNWSLVRGQAIRQEDETVHCNFPPSSQWPKVKPSTCTVFRGVTNVETSCTSDQELRQPQQLPGGHAGLDLLHFDSFQASYPSPKPTHPISNHPIPVQKGTKLPRASPSQLKSSHLAIKSIKFRGLKG